MSSRLLTATLGLGLIVIAYVGIFTAGFPTIYCPFPTFTAIPALILSTKHLEYIALLLPTLVFFAWNPRLLTDPGPRVPRRTPVLLALLTVLTIVDFVYEWPYGVQYHGIHYTRSIYALNGIWLLAIWWVGPYVDRPSQETCFRISSCLHG